MQKAIDASIHWFFKLLELRVVVCMVAMVVMVFGNVVLHDGNPTRGGRRRRGDTLQLGKVTPTLWPAATISCQVWASIAMPSTWRFKR